MDELTKYELYFIRKAINQASYDYPFRKKTYDRILEKIGIIELIMEIKGGEKNNNVI